MKCGEEDEKTKPYVDGNGRGFYWKRNGKTRKIIYGVIEAGRDRA
jgi:hypothetical protein